MKKIAALIGAGAMLLSVAAPALATVNINKAKIKNTTVVSAGTGGNVVGNGASVSKAGVSGSNVTADGSNTVDTGNAKVRNLEVTAANTNVNCGTCGLAGVNVNKAKVKSDTTVVASTGGNLVGNGASVEMAHVSGSNVTADGNNHVTTGDAAASNVGIILVNTQVSFP